jgi:DNA-binding ferritin-like protein
MTSRRSKSKSKKTTTRKSSSSSKMYSSEDIVKMFLEMLNTTKLYHWKTHSYAEHKSTDDLYSSLNGHVDDFVETMLGIRNGSRVNLTKNHAIHLHDVSNVSAFKSLIEQYKRYFVQMSSSDLGQHTDLMNIRDSILGDLDKLNYLLSFK